MTFIEVNPKEDSSVLGLLIKDAHMAIYQDALPDVHFGRIIVWEGRMFRQLEFSSGPNGLEYEERIFRTWKLPRARVMAGSVEGAVFTTPAEARGEPAARIQEGGRCGREYMVKPFYYSDYEAEA